MQSAEIDMMKEEILAERFSISIKKSQPQDHDERTSARLIQLNKN
jgi:hypothetical protein